MILMHLGYSYMVLPMSLRAMHASAGVLRIDVEGRQTHGASPWRGVDPIVAASQIIMGLRQYIAVK